MSGSWVIVGHAPSKNEDSQKGDICKTVRSVPLRFSVENSESNSRVVTSTHAFPPTGYRYHYPAISTPTLPRILAISVCVALPAWLTKAIGIRSYAASVKSNLGFTTSMSSLIPLHSSRALRTPVAVENPFCPRLPPMTVGTFKRLQRIIFRITPGQAESAVSCDGTRQTFGWQFA